MNEISALDGLKNRRPSVAQLFLLGVIILVAVCGLIANLSTPVSAAPLAPNWVCYSVTVTNNGDGTYDIQASGGGNWWRVMNLDTGEVEAGPQHEMFFDDVVLVNGNYQVQVSDNGVDWTTQGCTFNIEGPTATPTPLPSATPTQTATFTNTPSATATSTATATFTNTPTPSETPTPMGTNTPTATLTNTPTSTATLTDTPTPTATFTPVPTYTGTPTPTGTIPPTTPPTGTETPTPTEVTPTPTKTKIPPPTVTPPPSVTPPTVTVTPPTPTVTITPPPSITPPPTGTPPTETPPKEKADLKAWLECVDLNNLVVRGQATGWPKTGIVIIPGRDNLEFEVPKGGKFKTAPFEGRSLIGTKIKVQVGNRWVALEIKEQLFDSCTVPPAGRAETTSTISDSLKLVAAEFEISVVTLESWVQEWNWSEFATVSGDLIVGHLDDVHGKKQAGFRVLNYLEIGNQFGIREDTELKSFVVTDKYETVRILESYQALEQLASKPGIKILITCWGNWNPETGYSHYLVVIGEEDKPPEIRNGILIE